jgi:hypothetical protein
MSQSVITIGWTVRGDLRVDDIVEDQPIIEVKFYNTRPITRLAKLELLLELVGIATNTVELTEEPIMEVNNGNKEGTEE